METNDIVTISRDALVAAVADGLQWLYTYGGRHGAARIILDGECVEATIDGVPARGEELLRIENLEHIAGPLWEQALHQELGPDPDDDAVEAWLYQLAGWWVEWFGRDTLAEHGAVLVE